MTAAQTLTLTDFLLARIAEDEAVAKAADVPYFLYDLDSKGQAEFDHVKRWQPARVLAECEAKRQIVEDCAEAWEQRRPNGTPSEWGRHVWGGLEHACRALAAVYADHQDYRQEWRA